MIDQCGRTCGSYSPHRSLRAAFGAAGEAAKRRARGHDVPEPWVDVRLSLILVIDDEPAIRDVLRRMLERAGHEVLVAANGNVGLDLFRRQGADLVVTDVIMPEREGVETMREIKRIDPRAKVIVISGGGSIGADDFLHLAERLGADRTLAKPIDRAALMAAVDELLAEGRR